MKNNIRNIIIAVSILALVIAPVPRNVVASASDIVGTEIETGTTQAEPVSEPRAEETAEVTEPADETTTTEVTTAAVSSEETAEEIVAEPENNMVSGEAGKNNSNVYYNGYFGWIESNGSDNTELLFELEALNTTTTLDIPDYSVPYENAEVSIEWEKYNYDYANNMWTVDPESAVSGVTTPSVTTDPITTLAWYKCRLNLIGYGEIQWSYMIRINSGLSFTTYHDGPGGSYMEYTGDYSTTVNAVIGNSTTLQLPEIHSNMADSYTIIWYRNPYTPGTVKIDDAANSTSYTTEAITQYTEYAANVIDSFGNSITASYYVHPDTGLAFVKYYDGPGGMYSYTTNYHDESINITPGTSTTLELPEIVINDGSYSISWHYSYNDYSPEQTIEGANGSLYTTNAISEYTRYHALVTDEYGNSIDAYYYLTPGSGLAFVRELSEPGGTYIGHTDWYAEDVFVDYGSSTTLSLSEIYINSGLNYSIDWYENGMIISDEAVHNSTSCSTMDITTSGTTYKAIVSDDYGYSITAEFRMHINTGLTWEDGSNYWHDYTSVQPGFAATVAIPDILINDGIGYHISWYTEPGQSFDEAYDSRSFTTPVLTEDMYLYVEVQDDFGNIITARFNITIDSGLAFTENSYQSIPVKYGDDYNLVVPAFNIMDGLTPTYTWMRDYMPIDGETSATLSLTNITENGRYQCRVSDGYQSITAEFIVRVNTGLVWSNGSTNNYETISYIPGETLTIEMPAFEINPNIEATIQWYKNEKEHGSQGYWYYNTEQEITAEPDNSITVSNLLVNTKFIAVVSDPCGNFIRYEYEVLVDTGLTWADGTAGYYRYFEDSVAAGSSYDIVVPDFSFNSSITADDLTYAWYLNELFTDSSGYSYYRNMYHPEVTGNTLHLSDLQRLTQGYVRISDQYGNEYRYGFTIAINSGLAWKDGSRNGSTYVEVPYGGTIDLWVPEFAVNDGVNVSITIEGYFDGMYQEQVITADAVLTSDTITGGEKSYRIEIIDQYDNTISHMIYLRNNYSLSWANGSIYYMQNINVNDLSDTVVLQLPEYVYDGGEDLNITWTGADGRVSLDKKTCTIEGLEEPDVVYARINDRTANSVIIAAFNIGLASPLSFADGSTQTLIRVSAAEGESVQLTLPDIISEGELTYQWLRMSKDFAGGSKKGNLGSENTYLVTNAAFTNYYYACLITDEAGHRIRALYDILAPAHEYDSHGVCTLTGKYEAQAQYVSITLDGQIGLNFYVAVDQAAVDDGAYAVLTHGDDSETVTLSDAVKGSLNSQSVYKLTYHVDAKEINDLVSVSIYDQFGRIIKMHNASGVEIEEYSFSVDQYLARVGGTGISEFNELISSMSAYGNLAGKYFGTVNSYPVSEDTVAALAACTADTVQEYAAEDSGAIPSGIVYYGSSLVLDSDTSIYHYFKLINGASIDDYQFFVDGNEVTPIANGSLYRVEIRNIPAAELGRTFETVVAFAGNTSGYTISYSAYSYVYAAITAYGNDDSHADLLNAVKALYLYGNTANEYFTIRQIGNDGRM